MTDCTCRSDLTREAALRRLAEVPALPRGERPPMCAAGPARLRLLDSAYEHSIKAPRGIGAAWVSADWVLALRDGEADEHRRSARPLRVARERLKAEKEKTERVLSVLRLLSTELERRSIAEGSRNEYACGIQYGYDRSAEYIESTCADLERQLRER